MLKHTVALDRPSVPNTTIPNHNNDKPSSAESKSMLPMGIILNNRWKLLKLVGHGAFGQTFMTEDMNDSAASDRRQYAIKIEYISVPGNEKERSPAEVVPEKVPRKQVLRLEIAILKRLQGICPFVCEFKSSGKLDGSEGVPLPLIGSNFMVMQLLGQNLAEIKRQQEGTKFSVATTALLLRQMLAAIKAIHDIGYLHRDVKPSNFVLGLERVPELHGRQRCYIVDFGLARRYLTTEGQVRQPRDKAGFRGTARYAPINAHLNRELGRRDDLWSLFYVMVEFLRGSLPWRKEKDRDKIGVLKVKLTNQSLLQGLPYPCLRILDHILSLQYSQRPDYSYLDSLLQDLFDCSGESESVPYDWDSELISDAQEQSQLQQEPKAPSATSNQQENQEPPIQLQQTSVFETAAVLNDVEQAEASLQKLSILPQPPSTDSKNGILSFPFRLRRFLQRK